MLDEPLVGSRTPRRSHSRRCAQKRLCTLLPILGVCLTGFCVEFTWAINDLVVVPLLFAHGLPSIAITAAFLPNPVASLVLQPLAGWATDAMGRRAPLLAALLVTGLLSIVAMATADALPIGAESRGVLILLAFICADFSADAILLPGRALLTDLTLASGDGMSMSEASPIYAVFQNAGRFLALCCGILPIEALSSVLPAVLKLEGSARVHERLLLLVSAVVWVISLAGALVAVCRSDARGAARRLGGTAMVDAAEEEAAAAAVAAAGETGALHADAGLQRRSASCCAWLCALLPPRPVSWLCATHVVCWATVMCQGFFWTQFVGPETGIHLKVGAGGAAVLLRLAPLGMAAQALVATLASGAIHSVNAQVCGGAKAVYFASEFGYMSFVLLAGALALWRPGDFTVQAISTVLLALTGAVFAAHDSAPNILLEQLDGVDDFEQRRGYYTGALNASIGWGQIVMSTFSGVVLWATHGSIAALLVAGALAFGGVFAAVCAADRCCGVMKLKQKPLALRVLVE